jgi:hypothetical protein
MLYLAQVRHGVFLAGKYVRVRLGKVLKFKTPIFRETCQVVYVFNAGFPNAKIKVLFNSETSSPKFIPKFSNAKIKVVGYNRL